MPFRITCTDHQLETSELFSLASAAPGIVTVTGGTVWLSSGDGEDLIIGIGDCASAASDGAWISGTIAGPPACRNSITLAD